MRVEHIQITNLTGDLTTDTDICKVNWLAKVRKMGRRSDGGNHVTFRMDDGKMKTVGNTLPLEEDKDQRIAEV